MFFFKKKKEKNEIQDKLHELVKVLGTKLAIVEKEVELINGKLRQKIYRKTKEEIDEDYIESTGRTSGIDDGFNELRALRKGL